MHVDVDAFRAKRPWADITFYAALLSSLAMLLPLLVDAWGSATFPTGAQLGGAGLPLTAWLTMHGYLRTGAVKALGEAVAANPGVAVSRGGPMQDAVKLAMPEFEDRLRVAMDTYGGEFSVHDRAPMAYASDEFDEPTLEDIIEAQRFATEEAAEAADSAADDDEAAEGEVQA